MNIPNHLHSTVTLPPLEPALHMLDRALHGDAGALSFLEKTASIYILDLTKSPKTYGCWDFLNQALSEVERFEQNTSASDFLENHVRLLCTMSRKAARRCPESDQRLIGVCLANASSSFNVQSLIDLNHQTREQVMGRIAVTAFDFHSPSSAFRDPDGLCAILAANAVAHGPAATREFAGDWIVPAAATLPPMAVASVVLALATEGGGKAAPAGTGEELRRLTQPVLREALGPILTEALRDSDARDDETAKHRGDDSSDETKSQRLATIALRALERWCATTQMTIAHLNEIFSGSKVNITMTISDSLYSHSESIIDAAAELLDTLLYAGKQGNKASDVTMHMVIGRETEVFLSELVSAIGLQRFRFVTRQAQGDYAVCRCLARIAVTVAVSSQAALRAAKFEGSAAGIADLLLKAAAHPSILVCAIALEALPILVMPGHDLSDRILQVLQRRVVHSTPMAEQIDDNGMDVDAADIEEFERFREDSTETLIACYLNNRALYLESCAAAAETLLTSHPFSREAARQLEGVLFCLRAISIDASKRALLVNSSPAAQAAFARAFALRTGHDAANVNIAEDAALHNELLVRCVVALAGAPDRAASDPLVMAQTCRFIGQYANWFAKTPTPGVLNSGAELALAYCKSSGTAFRDDPVSLETLNAMNPSPFTEASVALRNLLCRAPSHFATSQALNALEDGWETSYRAALSADNFGTEDREALCVGICKVLTCLPSDKWMSSLGALSRPTVETLEAIKKRADDVYAFGGRPQEFASRLQPVLKRGASEIQLLASMTRTFNDAASTQMTTGCSTTVDTVRPSLALLRGSWPVLIHFAQKYSIYEVINEALGDFLTSSVSSGGKHLPALKESCEMANVILSVHSRAGENARLAPILGFVNQVVDTHGQDAERFPEEEIRGIVEGLLKAVGNATATPREQGQGQNPSEHESPSKRSKSSAGSSSAESSSSAAMFTLLTTCVERCPGLFLSLGGGGDDSLFRRGVRSVVPALPVKESDTTRAAMMFAKSLVDLIPSSRTREAPFGVTFDNDGRSNAILTVVEPVVVSIRQDVLNALIIGAFGGFPRETLDAAALLTFSLLVRVSADEGRSLLKGIFTRNNFPIPEASRVSVRVLTKCVDGTISPTYLMDFFGDLWEKHQTDDLGAAAGSDAMRQFELKYDVAPE